MADWPLVAGGNLAEAAGAVLASTTGTSVTGSATAHVKGAYAQLVAATAYEWAGFVLSVWHPSVTDSVLMDLAIGAAGSEQVIVPNLVLKLHNESGPALEEILVPLLVPKGVRLAARLQSAGGSSLVYRVNVRGLPTHTRMLVPFGIATNYGPDTATSDGIVVDPGGTAHTKGAYAQITASTTRPMRALQLQVGAAGGEAVVIRWLVDVAIGAAGSEQIIIADIPLHCPDFTRPHPQVRIALPVDIPSGTRIAVRAQSTFTTAGGRDLKVSVMGYD